MKFSERDYNEDRLQEECYLWFHNTFPHLRGLLCYNLNNSANKIQGNKNKGMGLQVGRSDMVFYYQGKAYMIEMKVADGVQRIDQIKWQNTVEAQGFKYLIARSKEGFKQFIYNILDNNI